MSNKKEKEGEDNIPQSKYKMYSQEEEDAYDIVAERNMEHPLGRAGSIFNLVKGALGSGILGGHVVYMKAGYAVSIFCNCVLGVYVAYCIYTIVANAQIIYKRTKTHTMSYPDLGEAAFALSGNRGAQKRAKCFRYFIDICIGCDLFGACCSYQIIMAKSIKQLVENVQKAAIKGNAPGYPPLHVYTALIWIPCALLTLVRRFSMLAKVSFIGNFIVFVCMLSTMYYCLALNPKFENMRATGSTSGVFELFGVMTFSMSCVCVVLPAENHLKNTYDYKCVHFTAYFFIIAMVVFSSFFGYAAFLDAADAPITVNFPMDVYPLILKVLIILMVLSTHALNFWIPFQLVWFYAQKKHINSKYLACWEVFYKILIVTGINILAILFPDVTAVMGFLGTLVLSTLIFVLPNIIEIYVYMPRPGYGKFKWRLWKCFILLAGGLIICTIGSYFTGRELVRTFSRAFQK